LRLLVADDSALIREGLVRILQFDPAIAAVTACASADEVLHSVDREPPDVVITDIRMPPTCSDEGIVLAAELRRRDPRIGVVVLSQHVAPSYAIRLLGGGSAGRAYLLKDRIANLDELSAAISAVAQAGCHIDPLVVEALAARGTAAGTLQCLTSREREILADIAEGWNNQAIADRRVLTRRAVEKHASSIFNKLGLARDEHANPRVRAVLAYLADAQP
jgi:DNA-binding NarL/FixJ family response regulator